MKRKCLIEAVEDTETVSVSCGSGADRSQYPLKNRHKRPRNMMPSAKDWLCQLQEAEKTSMCQDKLQKVHYKFPCGGEMVEEYNTETWVVIRRAWRKAGCLGDQKAWQVEVGIADPKPNSSLDEDFIRESNDQPMMERRNTRINLEWRIRNLLYPIETYSVAANPQDKSIVIRTTNKKFYKVLNIPELERIGVAPVQANIEYTYKYGTLIITYKKPKELLDVEKEWVAEIKKLKTSKDGIGDCKPS